jgi:hypothetical protein
VQRRRARDRGVEDRRHGRREVGEERAEPVGPGRGGRARGRVRHEEDVEEPVSERREAHAASAAPHLLQTTHAGIGADEAPARVARVDDARSLGARHEGADRGAKPVGADDEIEAARAAVREAHLDAGLGLDERRHRDAAADGGRARDEALVEIPAVQDIRREVTAARLERRLLEEASARVRDPRRAGGVDAIRQVDAQRARRRDGVGAQQDPRADRLERRGPLDDRHGEAPRAERARDGQARDAGADDEHVARGGGSARGRP